MPIVPSTRKAEARGCISPGLGDQARQHSKILALEQNRMGYVLPSRYCVCTPVRIWQGM